MLIQRIKLQNLLSFGPDAERSFGPDGWLEMKPLNVLIGPNGSGKSNLLEAVGLLRAAPRDLPAPIRTGGGVEEWIWKGEPKAPSASIDAILENRKNSPALHYRLVFAEKGHRLEVIDERLETAAPYPKRKNRSGETEGQTAAAKPYPGKGQQFEVTDEHAAVAEPSVSQEKTSHEKPYLYFGYRNGTPYINSRQSGEQRKLHRDDINPAQSILEQRRDPDHYPELTYVGDMLKSSYLYLDWSFGRDTPQRRHQPADLPVDVLNGDCSNLGLVLNQMKQNPKVKVKLLEALRKIYEGVTDFEVKVVSGTVQVVMQEDHMLFSMPATRLSDGTLRYLCLLAILCHPEPPPLVCIEEPELGLHPDILTTLADLLVEASERCQLVVTTHSDVLVDALSETPDSVVVCEKYQGQTEMRRLDKDKLKDWLEEYTLGQLWSKGELGGNRW